MDYVINVTRTRPKFSSDHFTAEVEKVKNAARKAAFQMFFHEELAEPPKDLKCSLCVLDAGIWWDNLQRKFVGMQCNVSKVFNDPYDPYRRPNFTDWGCKPEADIFDDVDFLKPSAAKINAEIESPKDPYKVCQDFHLSSLAGCSKSEVEDIRLGVVEKRGKWLDVDQWTEVVVKQMGTDKNLQTLANVQFAYYNFWLDKRVKEAKEVFLNATFAFLFPEGKEPRDCRLERQKAEAEAEDKQPDLEKKVGAEAGEQDKPDLEGKVKGEASEQAPEDTPGLEKKVECDQTTKESCKVLCASWNTECDKKTNKCFCVQGYCYDEKTDKCTPSPKTPIGPSSSIV